MDDLDETGTPRRIPGVRPRFDRGMGVELRVSDMQAQIRQYLQEHELGLEALLDQEVRRFLDHGMAEAVRDAVQKELPAVVEALIRTAVWDMSRDGDLRNVVAEKLLRGLRGTA